MPGWHTASPSPARNTAIASTDITDIDDLFSNMVIGPRNLMPRPVDYCCAGSRRGLWFHMAWAEYAPGGHDTLRLCVGEKVVWGTGDGGIEIELSALLGELTRVWAPAWHEQTASPDGKLGDVDAGFLARHTLKPSPGSPFGLGLCIVRSEGHAILEWRGGQATWSIADVMRTLGVLGDAIAARPGVDATAWHARDMAPG